MQSKDLDSFTVSVPGCSIWGGQRVLPDIVLLTKIVHILLTSRRGQLDGSVEREEGMGTEGGEGGGQRGMEGDGGGVKLCVEKS